MLERCRREGLPAARLPGRRGWSPAALAMVLRRAREGTILHTHDSHALGLGAVARALRPGLRLVAHRRVSYPVSSGLVSRWKYRRADGWVAVSAEVREVLRDAGIPGCRVAVVHSAIDLAGLRAAAAAADLRVLRASLTIPDTAPVVGFCGAFSPQKGHRVLVAAARAVLHRVPETVFLLPGEGELWLGVRADVEAQGLSGSFRFPGFRRDVAAVTSLFTLAAVPSIDGEGSSAAIKEPMALGVPVVASNLGGNLEVLAGAGVAFSRGDAEGLARVLVALLEDPERQRELGRLGRERAAVFAPATMTDGALAAYGRLRTGGVD